MKVIHKTGAQSAENPYKFIMSTSEKDLMGDHVVQDFDLGSFQQNPVALFGHDHKSIIGTWERVGVVGGKLTGYLKMAKAGTSDLVDEVRSLIEQKILRAVSVGFMTGSAEPLEDGSGFKLSKNVLTECSVVAVGANQSALLATKSLSPELREILKQSSEEETMQNQAPVGEVRTIPGVLSGDGYEYNLISVLQKMAQGHPIQGFEAEVGEELAKSCEGIADGPGLIVPEAMLRGARILDKRRVAHLKAAGALTGDNLEPLTGIGHHDELFRYVDGAITRQDVYSTIGATEITCTEATCRIPVMEQPATATHVGVDDPLADSADLGFRNVDIKPIKLGTVMEVLLSAMLSQHPQMYISQVLAELNRALNQEKARALIYGVKATDKIDGLLALATAAGVTSVPVDATSKAKIFEIQQELESYFQGTYSGRWLLHPGFIDGLKTVPSFTGSSFQALLDDNAGVLGNHPLVRSVGLAVAGATGSKTADGLLIGDPTAVVHPVWMGVRLDVNPWADSVYKKGSAILRAHMLHGFALSDPKAVLKFKTTIPG